jgi:uncharacterized protein (DUF1800 family)
MEQDRVGQEEGPGSLLQRRASRRALLVGSAGVAAAGTAGAVWAFAAGGDEDKAAAPAPRTGGTGGPIPSPTKLPDSRKQVADPLKRAAHLLRRAGFGGSLAEIDAFAALSREEAADRLLNYEDASNAALEDRLTRAGFLLRWVDEEGKRGQLPMDMQRWWISRMAYTARPLEERMTFIWHGLLTSQISKVGGPRAAWLVTQNELYRAHALGVYDDLIQAVSKDPAMLVYLDNVESTNRRPNENYARELCELFTMGEGNYTEDDVRESARAFTGWRLNEPPRPSPQELVGLTEQQKTDLRQKYLDKHVPAFRFDPRLHDDGQKTFLGETGNWNGDDIVRIIMKQPATGRYIATRLWKEFAYDDPEPAVIDRLAAVWDSSGHSIKPVVRAILVSDEFYSERAYFGKVRSPIEFVAGVLRALELESIPPNLNPGGRAASNYYAAMDQVLFEPPNVAGWPGGPNWLSSSTFFARLNFLDQHLFGRDRMAPIRSLAGATTPDALVDAVARRLVDGGLSAESRSAIAAHLAEIRDPAERAATAVYLVAGSPEFQVV